MAAQASLDTVAPPGTASATAAQVGDLVGVSTTGASAAPSATSASASVLEVGGEPILGLGGSTSGTGETGGALLDLGDATPIDAQVAPWEASSNDSGSTKTSSASAAAARAAVPDIVEADVLQSESQATHTATRSTGAGSSDALDLGLLGSLRLVLLHSQVSSEGHGHSYLVGLNGTEIGTGEQLGALCALNAGGLLSLSCLNASGGVGGGLTVAAADVVNARTGSILGAADPVAAFAVTGTSGTGSPADAVAAAPAETVAGATTEASRSVAPAAADAADQGFMSLPRTGAALAALATAALLALVAGAALRLFGRRPAMA